MGGSKWTIVDEGGLSARARPGILPPRDEAEAGHLALTVGSENLRLSEEAWLRLRLIGESAVEYLAAAYPACRHGAGRTALVYHCMKWGRANDAAFQLGLQALQDRSRTVRYRACMLLAWAQRKQALPALESLLGHPDPRTVEDARAAIDAITQQEAVRFIARGSRPGSVVWRMGSETSELRG